MAEDTACSRRVCLTRESEVLCRVALQAIERVTGEQTKAARLAGPLSLGRNGVGGRWWQTNCSKITSAVVCFDALVTAPGTAAELRKRRVRGRGTMLKRAAEEGVLEVMHKKHVEWAAEEEESRTRRREYCCCGW